jgi:NAD(P)-dependent dehydrogenase (short-subunit alcohol dehydrogenase family)
MFTSGDSRCADRPFFDQLPTPSLQNKRVLVTGGSMGIGLEVSRELARRGARVLVAARGLDAVDAAVEGLDGHGHSGLRLDVASADDWDRAFELIDAQGPLDGLVAAAGVLGPIGPLEGLDPEALSQTLHVNLLGTLLALHHAIPRLRRSGGRAVTFSGGGATSPLPRYDAYAVSKAAVVRLTENVAAAENVELNAVAPGFVATRMHQGTLDAGAEAAGADYHARTLEQLEAGGFPAREAAELVCFLISDEAAGITGKLLSAQWDPWREPQFRDRLRADRDLATLRRIDDQLFGRVPRAD